MKAITIHNISKTAKENDFNFWFKDESHIKVYG